MWGSNEKGLPGEIQGRGCGRSMEDEGQPDCGEWHSLPLSSQTALTALGCFSPSAAQQQESCARAFWNILLSPCCHHRLAGCPLPLQVIHRLVIENLVFVVVDGGSGDT